MMVTLPFRIHHTGTAENSQMLGRYRLFQAQFDVNIGHCHAIAFLEQVDDALPKLVVDSQKPGLPSSSA